MFDIFQERGGDERKVRLQISEAMEQKRGLWCPIIALSWEPQPALWEDVPGIVEAEKEMQGGRWGGIRRSQDAPDGDP